MSTSPFRRLFDGLPGPAQDTARRLAGRPARRQADPAALRDPDRAHRRGGVGREADGIWLDRVELIAPVIQECTDAIETDRELSAPLIAALRDASFGGMTVPSFAGGAGADLFTATRVVEEFSRLDSSVGWNMQVVAAHGRLAEYMTDEAVRRVFQDGSSILPGNISTRAVAQPVEGGYRVTGQWPFASGSAMADYFCCGAAIEPHGLTQSSGSVAVVMRPEDVEVLDTWYTTGLRGTGSHDVRVDDLFVPIEMTFPAQEIWRVQDAPDLEYGRPYGEHAPPLMAAVALGTAQAALEDFRGLVRAKLERPDTHWSAKMPLALHTLGWAGMAVQSSRTFLYDNVAAFAELGPGDVDYSLQSKAACRFVTEQCISVVDQLFEMAGGSAIYATSRLDRCLRDVHMVSHHVLVSSVVYGEAAEMAISMTE